MIRYNVIYRILRPAVVAITAIAVMTFCGADGPSGDSSSNGVEFIDVTHEDGTRYRCLWSYEDGGDDGGAGLWCERLNTTTTTEDLRGVHSLHATYSDDGECTGFISPEEALAAAEAKLAQL